jgi:hypothetical protein
MIKQKVLHASQGQLRRKQLQAGPTARTGDRPCRKEEADQMVTRLVCCSANTLEVLGPPSLGRAKKLTTLRGLVFKGISRE